MKFYIAVSHTDLPRTRFLLEAHAEGGVLAVAPKRLHPTRQLPTAGYPTNSRSIAMGRSASRVPAVRPARTESKERHHDKPPWPAAADGSGVAPHEEQSSELMLLPPALGWNGAITNSSSQKLFDSIGEPTLSSPTTALRRATSRSSLSGSGNCDWNNPR